MRTSALACCCFALATSNAFAQQIAVQEPALEQFGVGTTVSVPDSGRGLAGSARRRGSARSRFGRLPAGSNMNLSGQGGNFGVEVRAHDAEEKDLEARDLAQKSRKVRDQSPLSPGAEHAYQMLKNRAGNASGLVEKPARTSPAPHGSSGKKAAVEGPSAAKLLDGARAAEALGKRQLALSYLRVARDRGSPEAARELQRLGSK